MAAAIAAVFRPPTTVDEKPHDPARRAPGIPRLPGQRRSRPTDRARRGANEFPQRHRGEIPSAATDPDGELSAFGSIGSLDSSAWR